MNARIKMTLGSVMGTFAALVWILAILLGWLETSSPLVFLMGFVTGIVAGLGVTLGVSGLIEYNG